MQGESLTAKIRACYEVLQDLEAFRLKQPWWLPFSWFRRLAARKARQVVAPAIAAFCPDAGQRLLGIAAGSSVREDSLWLIHAMEGLLANVKDNTAIPPPCGCSALCLRSGMSAGGEPIIAHNFDYVAVVKPFFAIRESRPSRGYRSIEFTVAPLAGTLDGVNEHGLAVTYNYGQTVDEVKPMPTISMRLSELLARFQTVPEALDWLANSSRWGSGLLMLADRQGKMASLELSPTQVGVRFPADEEGYLYHTNKFQCPQTKAVEVAEDAEFNQRAPKALRGHRVLESSLKRNARFAELLSEEGPFSREDVEAIMADHGADGQPSENTICMHSDYWITTASIQCLPAARALRVSFGTACQAKFLEFAL
jgi:hypothetical protein